MLTSHKVAVDAPAKRVWTLLLDKMAHPEKYVPGVVSVEILKQSGPYALERRMTLASGAVIHEWIVADPLTQSVLFKLVDHPVYSGFVANVLFEEARQVWLDYTLHWTPKPGQPEPEDTDWADAIREAVLHTKALAEAAVPA